MTYKEGLIIAKAKESDIAEILRLQRSARQSEAEIYNDYSIQPLTQTLEQATTEFQESVVLKAVIDGDIYIGKLMVLPDYQNKGVGRLLLQGIENEFKGKRFELFTGTKSEKNIALYKKCGYTPFKTEEAAPVLIFVYMEKDLV